MVAVSILPQAEFGPNAHREDAAYFIDNPYPQPLPTFKIHSFGAGCTATMFSKYHANIEFSLCRPSNACSNNPNSILSYQYRY